MVEMRLTIKGNRVGMAIVEDLSNKSFGGGFAVFTAKKPAELTAQEIPTVATPTMHAIKPRTTTICGDYTTVARLSIAR